MLICSVNAKIKKVSKLIRNDRPSRKNLKFTDRGKKCRLLKQANASLAALFSSFSTFFPLQRLGTGFALILLAVKRPMDWVTTNKSL